MLTGAATVFTVRDLGASIAHYRDVWGFAVIFQYGEPPYYACLCRDEVAIHFAQQRPLDAREQGNRRLRERCRCAS